MLTKWHGAGDPDSAVVTLEYEEICQTLAFEKSVQKINFKALFSTRPNRWRMGCNIAVAGKLPPQRFEILETNSNQCSINFLGTTQLPIT
jgi:hypothetical protein